MVNRSRGRKEKKSERKQERDRKQDAGKTATEPGAADQGGIRRGLDYCDSTRFFLSFQASLLYIMNVYNERLDVQ